jgi:hypothetical protein
LRNREAQAGTYSIKVGDASNNLALTGSTSLAHELSGQVAAGATAAPRVRRCLSPCKAKA